ncbi:DUF192 domain-containing protein [Candidatus Kaiserbacteria bacterium]|nr:MAG: DUF192 domain-containing protein [Candidatus Kaiserbacteria bacterium]
MRNRIQVLIILILIPLGGLYLYLDGETVTMREFFFAETPVVHFGDLPVRVEIVDSEIERAQGLSGREKIDDRYKGMFFIFPEEDYIGIWMKDMKFSIDIVWIDEDLTVIGIEKNVSPNTYPRVFRPNRPAKYVLETETQYPELIGIHVGQKVRIPLEY